MAECGSGDACNSVQSEAQERKEPYSRKRSPRSRSASRSSSVSSVSSSSRSRSHFADQEESRPRKGNHHHRRKRAASRSSSPSSSRGGSKRKKHRSDKDSNSSHHRHRDKKKEKRKKDKRKKHHKSHRPKDIKPYSSYIRRSSSVSSSDEGTVVKRSIISGRKIKLHRHKDRHQRQLDRNREELLGFLNSCYSGR